MADLSIQFHALPEEILPLLQSFADSVDAYGTFIRFHPFEAFRIERASIASADQDESVRRIVLTLMTPVLPVGDMNEFLDRNPDALLLDIGRMSDVGLKESWLTARTENLVALAAWRRFAKRLRSITRTGVRAVNPQNGATSKLREHRFSAGAKALEREGVPMLPAAGSSRLKFDDYSG